MNRLIDNHRANDPWPADLAGPARGFSTERTLSFERGDGITVSRLELDVHTGTHVE
jgi:hypothetical protein